MLGTLLALSLTQTAQESSHTSDLAVTQQPLPFLPSQAPAPLLRPPWEPRGKQTGDSFAVTPLECNFSL